MHYYKESKPLKVRTTKKIALFKQLTGPFEPLGIGRGGVSQALVVEPKQNPFFLSSLKTN